MNIIVNGEPVTVSGERWALGERITAQQIIEAAARNDNCAVQATTWRGECVNYEIVSLVGNASSNVSYMGKMEVPAIEGSKWLAIHKGSTPVA